MIPIDFKVTCSKVKVKPLFRAQCVVCSISFDPFTWSIPNLVQGLQPCLVHISSNFKFCTKEGIYVSETFLVFFKNGLHLLNTCNHVVILINWQNKEFFGIVILLFLHNLEFMIYTVIRFELVLSFLTHCFAVFGKKLEEDIISDTSGHFKRLMVSLASVNIESSKILLNQNIWQLRLSVWLFFYLCFPCALHVFYLCFVFIREDEWRTRVWTWRRLRTMHRSVVYTGRGHTDQLDIGRGTNLCKRVEKGGK